MMLPVIVSVPVELCVIEAVEALDNPTDGLVIFPTIAAEFVPLIDTILVFVLLCVISAVKVTPLVKTNVPVPALLIKSQVALAVMVMVAAGARAVAAREAMRGGEEAPEGMMAGTARWR